MLATLALMDVIFLKLLSLGAWQLQNLPWNARSDGHGHRHRQLFDGPQFPLDPFSVICAAADFFQRSNPEHHWCLTPRR
jgi:hypothetical protein